MKTPLENADIRPVQPRRFVSQILMVILATSSLIFCSETLAQTAPYATRSPNSPYRSNVRVTYGGNMIMDMGNYDIVFGSPPRNSLTLEPTLPQDLTGLSANDAASVRPIATAPQIVFKSPSGLRWDGSNYLRHPAYPNELVSRQRYLNRVVGRGNQQYPPTGECTPAPCVNVIGTWQLPFNEYAKTLQMQRVQANRPTQPLPLTTVSGGPNPDLCQQYPYLVQCNPAWVQPKFAAKTKTQPKAIRNTVKPRPRATPAPQWEMPRPERIVIPKPRVLPIVIVNLDDAKTCSYTLQADGREYSFTLKPGDKHEVAADRDWRIRFDSQGWGTMTYQLQAGDNYHFTKNKSDVWELKKPAVKGAPNPHRNPHRNPKPRK